MLQGSKKVHVGDGATSPTIHLDGHLQSSSPSSGGEGSAELSTSALGFGGVVVVGCPAQLVANCIT